MSADVEFDVEVEDLMHQIEPLLAGRPLGIVLYALAELLCGGIVDQEDKDYVIDLLNELLDEVEFGGVSLH